ncbi:MULTISPECIES: hypothetical protein [unclassified Meridianimarinicoccus]|uniref:hypothetical protein n=1 Tax=unclassified Meridianimarinicoccus TaxID=2923344 RepID=UPI0018693021|nr:hypothetical protein [Fluviibacterium sp. MJW13]
MTSPNPNWQRLLSRTAFLKRFADRELVGDGLRFVIHADGRITGQAGTGKLSGQWYWEDGYFCRTASLDGEDLGLDCEIIEYRGDSMRYTRNKGEGEASVVAIAS